MAPLASPTDLSDRLGRTLSEAEQTRATALLGDASAAIRAYTGQTFIKATTTDRLPVRKGRIRLPQRPVNEVSAVADVDGNAVAFTWDAGQYVYVDVCPVNAFEVVPRRTPLRFADVTYDHGYTTVPDEIVAVTCQIVLRALGVDPLNVGYQSESIDGYSYTVGAAAAAGGIGMLAGERQTLDRYRLAGGTITVGL